ncbi:MAG: Fibronectin type-III protein [Anaerolineales bacterium]|nr:Fibronectin type-III protein [Anaerolineales bacterium]
MRLLHPLLEQRQQPGRVHLHAHVNFRNLVPLPEPPALSTAAQVTLELTATDADGGQVLRRLDVYFQTVAFNAYAQQPVNGRWFDAVLWADLNGDGTLELLVGSVVGQGLAVRVVRADGLPEVASLTVPPAPGEPLDVGDVDNDGDVDVLAAVTSREGGFVVDQSVVFRNEGDWRFELQPSAVFPALIARFADLDLDGRLDVIAGNTPLDLKISRNP